MGHDHASVLTQQGLCQEKSRYAGTAGSSEGNRGLGFRPAFLDSSTGRCYLSAFADGRPAPVHVLDGLPDALVAARGPSGRVCALKPGVVSGFARGGQFHTREEALRLAEEEEDFALAA